MGSEGTHKGKKGIKKVKERKDRSEMVVGFIMEEGKELCEQIEIGNVVKMGKERGRVNANGRKWH